MIIKSILISSLCATAAANPNVVHWGANQNHTATSPTALLNTIYGANACGITSLDSIQLDQNHHNEAMMAFRVKKTATVHNVQSNTYLTSVNAINAMYFKVKINFQSAVANNGATNILYQNQATHGFALPFQQSVTKSINQLAHNKATFKKLFNLALKDANWTNCITGMAQQNPTITEITHYQQTAYYRADISYYMGKGEFISSFNFFHTLSSNQIVFPDIFALA